MSNIKVTIDVTKIIKDQLFQGEKGIYFDLILIPTPNNQYGNDYLVKQNNKGRELSKNNPVLRNTKNFGGKPYKEPETPKKQGNDLPF